MKDISRTMTWALVLVVVVTIAIVIAYIMGGDAAAGTVGAGAVTVGTTIAVRRRMAESAAIASAIERASDAVDHFEKTSADARAQSGDIVAEVAGMSGNDVASAIDDLTGGS